MTRSLAQTDKILHLSSENPAYGCQERHREDLQWRKFTRYVQRLGRKCITTFVGACSCSVTKRILKKNLEESANWKPESWSICVKTFCCCFGVFTMQGKVVQTNHENTCVPLLSWLISERVYEWRLSGSSRMEQNSEWKIRIRQSKPGAAIREGSEQKFCYWSRGTNPMQEKAAHCLDNFYSTYCCGEHRSDCDNRKEEVKWS